ncbi:MAG: carbohydrate-binding protein [Myxococcota bacterium]
MYFTTLGLLTASLGLVTVAHASTTRAEAEDAGRVGARLDSGHSGYSGTGYVDYVNADGDVVYWSIQTDGASATLTFRYANGSTSDRELALSTNGTAIGSVRFPPTGSWATWDTVSVDAVSLPPGTTSIQMATTGVHGPNLDYLELSTTGSTTAAPSPAASDIEGRALRNQAIVSCYADMTQAAYDGASIDDVLCDDGLSVDPRNGMGEWTYTGSGTTSGTTGAYDNILGFWERTSGNRKEIAINLRGSVSIGDWLRDFQSQVFYATFPQDTDISPLESDPNLLEVSGGRFERGFFNRVYNIAPTINSRIGELQIWLASNAGRSAGIKVIGHSLGAATATIAGTYVADRFANRNDIDVEVFAFNSPRAVGRHMAKVIRTAATSCQFNFHTFNNVRDVVSQIPRPASQVWGDTSVFGDSLNETGDDECRYDGHYTAHFGVQNDRPTGVAGWIASRIPMLQIAEFVLNRHMPPQWQLSDSTNHISLTPKETAADWFPIRDLGAQSGPTRTPRSGTIDGTFTAALYSPARDVYVSVANQGGSTARADASSVGADELLRIVPDHDDCARNGGQVTLSTIDGTRHFLHSESDNSLHARELGTEFSVPQMSFTLINHTDPADCIKEGDEISLQSYYGFYVVAEHDGRLRADRTRIGSLERFEVQSVDTDSIESMDDFPLDIGGEDQAPVAVLSGTHLFPPTWRDPDYSYVSSTSYSSFTSSFGPGARDNEVMTGFTFLHEYDIDDGWVMFLYNGTDLNDYFTCVEGAGNWPSSGVLSWQLVVSEGCPREVEFCELEVDEGAVTTFSAAATGICTVKDDILTLPRPSFTTATQNALTCGQGETRDHTISWESIQKGYYAALNPSSGTTCEENVELLYSAVNLAPNMNLITDVCAASNFSSSNPSNVTADDEEVLKALNSSLANLRCGYSSPNSSIGGGLDVTCADQTIGVDAYGNDEIQVSGASAAQISAYNSIQSIDPQPLYYYKVNQTCSGGAVSGGAVCGKDRLQTSDCSNDSGAAMPASNTPVVYWDNVSGGWIQF